MKIHFIEIMIMESKQVTNNTVNASRFLSLTFKIFNRLSRLRLESGRIRTRTQSYPNSHRLNI